MNTIVIDRVVEQLRALPQELQWRVLAFTQTLAPKAALQGVPGHKLLSFAGGISRDDLTVMSQAIKRGCEQVDEHEW